MIPKVHNAERLTDSDLLVAAMLLIRWLQKIIARRLQLILPDMISHNQIAFIKGRQIVKNVILASELV